VKEINPSESGEAAVQGLNNILRADQPRVAERYIPQTEVFAVRYAPQVASPSPLHWERTVNGPAFPPATYAQRGGVQILPPPRVLSDPIHQTQAVRISYATGHPGVMGTQYVRDNRYSSPGIRLA
jgi:hypothetical protein